MSSEINNKKHSRNIFFLAYSDYLDLENLADSQDHMKLKLF